MVVCGCQASERSNSKKSRSRFCEKILFVLSTSFELIVTRSKDFAISAFDYLCLRRFLIASTYLRQGESRAAYLFYMHIMQTLFALKVSERTKQIAIKHPSRSIR